VTGETVNELPPTMHSITHLDHQRSLAFLVAHEPTVLTFRIKNTKDDKRRTMTMPRPRHHVTLNSQTNKVIGWAQSGHQWEWAYRKLGMPGIVVHYLRGLQQNKSCATTRTGNPDVCTT